ncbi:MAG: hypothetical protein PHX34_04265 [Candidatus Shapirobacteria bacterium]|nr:hypothetical protein [Candidatus Shapirobacteria bacterium]
MKKLFNSGYFYFGVFLLLLLFCFRSLFVDFGRNLVDWFDYPYIIWAMYQNIGHLKNLDLVNFFNTNTFYPFTNTLLFSDTFLPQTIIALPFSFFIKNTVMVFNISFLINFVLNYIALYFFWKCIFKNKLTAFLGSIFFIFSPFFYTQFGHFQMLTYWPFFFSLYFLLRKSDHLVKNSIISGLFLALQFLASVYLSVFLLCTICIWTLVDFFYSKKSKVLLKILLILLTFFILDGVFIKSYVDVQKQYQVTRDIHEYILYSAHLSDYVFTSSIRSVLHQSKLLTLWNKSDKHVVGERGQFIGFLFFILFILGAFGFNKIKSKKFFSFELNKYSIFSTLILIIGLVFSLGPRLNFNGVYVHIPLPYSFLLKYVPFFDSIRALARWSFLVYLGVLYFCLLYLNKLITVKKSRVLIGLIFMFFLIEYFPKNITSSSKVYMTNDYTYLKSNCNNKVLIEIPYIHLFGVRGNIVDGLGYMTTILLSSLEHSCSLVNGHGGYDLPENMDMFKRLNEDVANIDYDQFLSELNVRNVSFIKFNKEFIVDEDKLIYQQMFDTLIKEKKIKNVSENIYQIN